MSAVTVILPCYNAEGHLAASLDSLLAQDHRALRVLCVDDGSTDGTPQILSAYLEKDTRVTMLRNESNIGLIRTLNRALAEVDTPYFARMDADDTCAPDRIRLQVAYLEANRHTGLVSCGYNYMSAGGRVIRRVKPVALLPGALKMISVFSTPLAHAAVAGRTSLIKSGRYRYSEDFPHAEDFGLFSRLALEDVKVANLPQRLYNVRLHAASVSRRHADTQVSSNIAIVRRNLAALYGREITATDEAIAVACNRMRPGTSAASLREGLGLLKDLAAHARRTGAGPEEMKEIRRHAARHSADIILNFARANYARRPVRAILSARFLRPAHVPWLLRKLAAASAGII